ncbi:MAG: FG-GAP repeat protein [Planctomycetes bacterium]|nr:FG-GAP repeat protein [Planctomycetota bacterium]
MFAFAAPRAHWVCLGLLSGFAGTAWAQTGASITLDWSETTTISPASGQFQDFFGSALAFDGDTLAIGAAQRATSAGADSGAVLVHRRNGSAWTLEQEIVPPAFSANDRMGTSVALFGDVLAAGAPTHWVSPTSVGVVRIYERSGATWSLQQELSLAAARAFGASADMDGDTLVVGDPDANTTVIGEGNVTLWVRQGSVWTFAALLTGDAGTVPLAHFGTAVALDGDRLIVGAPSDDVGTQSRAGRAYAFERTGTTWNLAATLQTSTPNSEDQFGSSVAINGDLVAIGATNRRGTLGQTLGTVSVYRWQGASLTLETEVSPLDMKQGGDMDFGSAVALTPTQLAVGTPMDDMNSGSSGSVYLYRDSGGTWVESEKLVTKTPSGAIGRALEFAGNSVIVGAPSGSLTGQVHVFDELTEPLATLFCFGDGSAGLACPCGNDSYAGSHEGCRDAHLPHGGNLFPVGSRSIATNGLTMYGRLLPGPKQALLVSPTQTSSTVVLGNGLTCLPTNGLSLGFRSTVPPGLASWNVDLQQAGFATPGTTRYFQVWVRNAPFGACLGRANTTNAVSVTFTP